MLNGWARWLARPFGFFTEQRLGNLPACACFFSGVAMDTKGLGVLKMLLISIAHFFCLLSFGTADENALGSAEVMRQQVFKVNPSDESKAIADHPLQQALQIARQVADRIEREVKNYTCDLVMRERIRGRLGKIYLAEMKVRCADVKQDRSGAPFSVYLHFKTPENVQGREVLYVQNQNDGKLLARNGGLGNLKDVTISMEPNSKRAMRGRHYPVTEVGISNIVRRLIEEAEQSMQIDLGRHECEVRVIENARIEGRLCRCIQVVFPVRREGIKFHLVRIFLDSENDFPLRYAAYSWPREKGGSPRLIEEYTFLNLKVNPGLSDSDFDRNNPAYDFYSRDAEGAIADSVLPTGTGN